MMPINLETENKKNASISLPSPLPEDISHSTTSANVSSLVGLLSPEIAVYALGAILSWSKKFNENSDYEFLDKTLHAISNFDPTIQERFIGLMRLKLDNLSKDEFNRFLQSSEGVLSGMLDSQEPAFLERSVARGLLPVDETALAFIRLMLDPSFSPSMLDEIKKTQKETGLSQGFLFSVWMCPSVQSSAKSEKGSILKQMYATFSQFNIESFYRYGSAALEDCFQNATHPELVNKQFMLDSGLDGLSNDYVQWKASLNEKNQSKLASLSEGKKLYLLDAGNLYLAERLDGQTQVYQVPKVAIFTFPKFDHNGAFVDQSQEFQSLLDNGYHLLLYETSNDEQFADGLLNGGIINPGPVDSKALQDVVYLNWIPSGHGNTMFIKGKNIAQGNPSIWDSQLLGWLKDAYRKVAAWAFGSHISISENIDTGDFNKSEKFAPGAWESKFTPFSSVFIQSCSPAYGTPKNDDEKYLQIISEPTKNIAQCVFLWTNIKTYACAYVNSHSGFVFTEGVATEPKYSSDMKSIRKFNPELIKELPAPDASVMIGNNKVTIPSSMLENNEVYLPVTVFDPNNWLLRSYFLILSIQPNPKALHDFFTDRLAEIPEGHIASDLGPVATPFGSKKR